jgi:hypothetical protein
VIPGLLATVAIVYAIRHAPPLAARERQPIQLRLRPVARGRLGRLLLAVGAFEFGNLAATLLILRATELFEPGRSTSSATQLALVLYTAYNLAATLASVPPVAPATGSAPPACSRPAPPSSSSPNSDSPLATRAS